MILILFNKCRGFQIAIKFCFVDRRLVGLNGTQWKAALGLDVCLVCMNCPIVPFISLQDIETDGN